MSSRAAFALIDGAAAPARSDELRHHAALADLQHRSLFAGQPEEEHTTAAPWLIALPTGGIQRPFHHWMASLGQSQAGITTLASNVPFEVLFEHLQALLDIVLPDGSLALMRFYDPRAWLRYCDVLTAPQQLALLGPVLEWQVTVQGKSWCVSRAELERTQKAADAAVDR